MEYLRKLLVAIFTLISQMVGAQTVLYVSTTGNYNYNDNSSANAFRMVQRVLLRQIALVYNLHPVIVLFNKEHDIPLLHKLF